MRLQDVMTTDVATIQDTDLLVAANELMWRKQIHHLVVVRDGAVVGVLSDTDLGGSEATDIPKGVLVKDVMSTDPVTALPTTTVRDAMNLMTGRAIRCLPLLDDANNLVGIVTSTDLDAVTQPGTPPVPPDNKRAQSPYVALSDRDRRGATSKHGHSDWPNPVAKS